MALPLSWLMEDAETSIDAFITLHYCNALLFVVPVNTLTMLLTLEHPWGQI